MTHEIINEKDFGKCLKLSNDIIEIVTTLELGPRIIYFNLKGGINILNPIKNCEPNETPWGKFYTYGGHRLWHAPEVSPRTYHPDNDPIKYEITDTGAIFYYNFEEPTGMAKKFEIIISENNTVEVKHTITNKNLWTIKTAPWALSVMAPGGRLIIPQEPFIPHTEKLLPARPMVLWNYTNMADRRWTFGEKFVILRNDKNINTPQKMGFLDKLGWAAYQLNDTVFIKSFEYEEGNLYEDYMCNLETFTNSDFHEFETIAPIRELKPNEDAIYSEKWAIFNNISMNTEDEIEKELNKLIKQI